MKRMAARPQFTQERIRREEQFDAMALPLWREALLGLDWLSLRASAVYRCIGVPRGDGSAVVLVPGFLGTDQYLGDMFSWLRRLGYQPYMSGMGWNAECPHPQPPPRGRAARPPERPQPRRHAFP